MKQTLKEAITEALIENKESMASIVYMPVDNEALNKPFVGDFSSDPDYDMFSFYTTNRVYSLYTIDDSDYGVSVHITSAMRNPPNI